MARRTDGFNWRAFTNAMSGPAFAWQQRFRRKLEHPEWKEVTPPSYEEIAKLVKQVIDLQSALGHARQEVARSRAKNIETKRRIDALAKWVHRLQTRFNEGEPKRFKALPTPAPQDRSKP